MAVSNMFGLEEKKINSMFEFSGGEFSIKCYSKCDTTKGVLLVWKKKNHRKLFYCLSTIFNVEYNF